MQNKIPNIEETNKFLEALNDNTGLILIIGVIIYFIKEIIRILIEKNLSNHNSKTQILNPKTYTTEEKLFEILSTFYFSGTNDSNDMAIVAENIRRYITGKSLYIRPKIRKISLKFVDYILEEAVNTGRNPKGEKKILEEYNKRFRS